MPLNEVELAEKKKIIDTWKYVLVRGDKELSTPMSELILKTIQLLESSHAE